MQLQRDDLGIKVVCRDADAGDRNWEFEAPGTGTAGIEPEHAVAHLDRRLVRVPEYYCRVAGADRIEGELGAYVQKEEAQLGGLDNAGAALPICTSSTR